MPMALAALSEPTPDYQIVTLTQEERAPFKEAAKEVQASFASKSASNKKLLDQMMADLKEAEEKRNNQAILTIKEQQNRWAVSVCDIYFAVQENDG